MSMLLVWVYAAYIVKSIDQLKYLTMENEKIEFFDSSLKYTHLSEEMNHILSKIHTEINRMSELAANHVENKIIPLIDIISDSALTTLKKNQLWNNLVIPALRLLNGPNPKLRTLVEHFLHLKYKKQFY